MKSNLSEPKQRKQRFIPYPNRLCVKVSDDAFKKLDWLSKHNGHSISISIREAINDYIVNCEVPENIEPKNSNQLDLFDD